jgi:hypothetical protein
MENRSNAPTDFGEPQLSDTLMTFLADEQRDEMLANGAARARGDDIDPYPVLKLYTPDSGASWVLTSLDADGDTAYGLIDMGAGFTELGVVSLSMLAGIKGPRGVPVAVEPNYKARKTLSAYVADAQRDGMVTD